jgi:hypothetical protein
MLFESNLQQHIQAHLDTLPDGKRKEMQELHTFIKQWLPQARLWFDDGKNEDQKLVTNPTIGFGQFMIRYANGTTKDFFQIGLSANQSGISVYILGLSDKTYLAQHVGPQLGKAKVTGYCIKFKKLSDINLEVLEAAIRYGVAHSV